MRLAGCSGSSDWTRWSVVDRRDGLVGRAHSGLVAGGLRRISKAEECKGEKLGNAMQYAAIGDRKLT